MESGSKTEPALRLPPQNLEAEQCVLGAALLQNDSLLRVIEILQDEDFYRTAQSGRRGRGPRSPGESPTLRRAPRRWPGRPS
ncbi:MAG: DnaB-like helicase N-terminal domain-containing protein [Thermodesulfobacteriota bacterium]